MAGPAVSRVPANFGETANADPPASIAAVSGSNQKGTVATTLPAPVVVSVKDHYQNAVSGVSVSFTDKGIGGIFNPTSANTNSIGQASSYYTLPTKASPLTVYAITGSPASVNYVSGNHQSAPPNTLLPAPLVVAAKDQYGNLVAGATVTLRTTMWEALCPVSAWSSEATEEPASLTSLHRRRGLSPSRPAFQV